MGWLERVKHLFKPSAGRLDVSARFEISRHAYTGTMSQFRVATEIATRKVYGIKFLDTEKTRQFHARFKGLKKPSEGEIAVQFHHPNIVETYEFGRTTTGQEYILMEYIRGPGLNTLISERSAKLEGRRLDMIRQMAEAIETVHQAGFIHRDICPRNFICTADIDSLKLIDFGLSVPDKPEFRQPGNRTGTPQYMAPEVVRRRTTDHRLDIFSFGVTAYRLLTFEHPWDTTETSGLAALAHDTREPRDILKHRPQLEPRLARAVMRCLAKTPDDRPASVRQFLQWIREVRSEEVNPV